MLRFPAVLRRLALLAVFSLLAVACSDTLPTAPGPDAVTPPAADFGMLASLQAQRADLSGQYVVVLNGKGMGALESTVQKLGGSVMFSHSIGLAVVTGISEKAAAELGKEKAVTEMFQDFRFKLRSA